MYNRSLIGLAWNILDQLLPSGRHQLEYTGKGIVLKLNATQEEVDFVKGQMLMRDKGFNTWKIVKDK